MENNEGIKNPLSEMAEEVNDAIKDLPDDKKRIVQRTISLSMQGVMPMANPIIDKITPEHIQILITNADEEAKREDADKKDIRRYNLIITFIVLVFLAILLVVFKDNLDGISKIINPIIGAVLGFAGGYGYGFNKGKQN